MATFEVLGGPMPWHPVTFAHVVQGALVATGTQIVQTADHSVETTLITAVGGIVAIIVANVTTDWLKRRKSPVIDHAAKIRKLRREITALRKQLAAQQKLNEQERL